MVVKVKTQSGKEYYPQKIRKFRSYRDKLQKVLNDNPNLQFLGVCEYPSKKYGILAKGKDSFGISDIELFYSLGEITYYYNQMIGENPNDQQ